MDRESSRHRRGGQARTQALSAEQRTDIARRAALARWRKFKLPSGSVAPKAIASGILPVGELPCAVLDDSENTRVLTQTGILRALGRFATPRSVASHGVVPLPPFLRAKNLARLIHEGCLGRLADVA